MSQKISEVRSPIAELLSTALRAEKAIKAGIDRAKKAAAKKEQDEQKARKATEQAGVIALYDEGVAMATPIPAVDLAARGDLDLARPFIVKANDWVSRATKEQSPMGLEISNFATSFDAMRAKQKGARASKAVECTGGDFDFGSLVQALFKEGSLVADQNIGEHLKKQLASSPFGIDQSYDRVSCECCSMSSIRLTLSGTRSVVVADTLQLVGFMRAKGVTGTLTTPRVCSFFRSCSTPMLTELKDQCSIYAATVGPGDVIYVPAGAVIGELCRSVNVGLRRPVVVHGSVSPTIALTFQRRKEELEGMVSAASQSDPIRAKCAPEIAVVEDLLKGVSSVRSSS